MLPTQQLLAKVSSEIRKLPNKQGEYLRKIHYGCFLLGYKSGLRISEAVKFDLSAKNKHDLYRINKPKGKKERFVYIPKEVINQLKRNNWQPNQTNRFNFYHFLKKIKRELNISAETELTPHTLRRSFTTYHAEKGMPLPLLQQLLGHSSIRTTALYWQNIYSNDGDISPILTAKNWLERPKSSQKKNPLKPPRIENFAPPNKIITDYLFSQVPKSPEPILLANKPVIPSKEPIKINNSPLLTEIDKIPPNAPRKFFLDNAPKKSDQLETNQPLALIANHEEKPSIKEQILLAKIKSLEKKLRKTTIERDNLNIAKLKAETLAQQEKQRADHYQQQLAKETQAQIIQLPPWKFK